MCGIAGLLTDDVPGQSRHVDAMVTQLRHRGPDDQGRHEFRLSKHGGPAWLLGHTRLAILDLTSAGHQPMVDPKSGNVVVFNGEVYNFQDLRAELEADGFVFSSRTDTEVILLGYARWGADVIERLRGAFAVAIADAAAGTLVLARDRLGEKPLYYVDRPADPKVRFAFASEVRALLAGEIVPATIDRTGLQVYLTNGFVVGPHTLIDGIRLLEPGTMLTVDAEGTCRSRRFWQIPLGTTNGPAHDAASGLADLSEALSDSVRRQLVSDAPLGAFLSGGIDSSVVVGLAQQHASKPLRTFTLVFEEGSYSEAPYATRVAELFGTDHHEVMLTHADFLRSLPRAVGALDQPSFDGANTYFVSQAARDLGLTVALAGTGGDELFGGYASFSQLGKAQLLRRVASVAPAGLRRRLARLALKMDGRRRGGFPSQTKLGKMAALLGGQGEFVHLYQTMYRIFLEETIASLLIDYDDSLTPDGMDPQTHDYLSARTNGTSDLTTLSFLELRNFLGNRLLRDTDSVSMAVSLEVRLPLVDYRLIEEAGRLDDRVRYEPLGSKRALVEASCLNLPTEITHRTKQGFVLPIDVWLRDTLRQEASEVLLNAALCRRVGLQPESVATLWSQFLRGDSGLYWTRIWAIYVLLRWCDDHGASLAA